MSRTSAGDQKIAELRTALTSEVATHEHEIDRLESLVAAERRAMMTKSEMLDRLGPVTVPRVRKPKAGGLPL